ncbi:MAG: hypothetical protein WC292_02500 [Clostridia bacterium]
MMIIMLIIYVAVILIDLVPLIKEKKKKETIILSITLAAGLIGSILFIMRADIPKPLQWIEEFIKNVLKIGYSDNP